MTVLFVLLTLVIGSALLLGGYRLAQFVIPLWGFLAGLSIGGSIITDIEGTSFLGTVLGIFVGVILGIILGAFAYFYYYLAVVVLLGTVGYWLGSGFITMFGIEPGLLSALVGGIVGLALGLVALVLNAPKYVLIFVTSIAGAMTLVGGGLVLFDQIPLESFSYAAVNQSVNNSFIWLLTAVALMFVGIVFQLASTVRYSFESWALSGVSGDDGQSLTTHHTGAH